MNILIAVAIAMAVFLAWNNGSNNAANMVGTVVGAEVMELRKALRISSIATVAGAFLLGRYVIDTVAQKIVNVNALCGPEIVAIAVISVLISASLWTLLCSFLRVPMSVHACVIGGLVGIGMAIGLESVSWSTLIRIFVAWLLIPFVTALLSFALFKVVNLWTLSRRGVGSMVSMFAFVMAFVPAILSLAKSRIAMPYAIALALAAGSIATLATYRRLVRSCGDVNIDCALRMLLIESSIAMSFAFGSNSVANAAGPLAMVLLANDPSQGSGYAIALSSILVGAALAIGIVTWGSSTVETVGKKITLLSIESAFTAQLSAALVMAILSRLGIPASTSMAIVGGVMGVGMARGVRNIEFRTIAKIMVLWYSAIPAVASISYALFKLMKFFA